MNPLDRYRWPGESERAYLSRQVRSIIWTFHASNRRPFSFAIEVDTEEVNEGLWRFGGAVESLVEKGYR